MPSSQERTQLKTVTGFIVELPSKKSDESDDDEDDDDDDNWLDYSQIKAAFSQGAFVKMSRKPRYSRGKPLSPALAESPNGQMLTGQMPILEQNNYKLYNTHR